MKCINCNVTYIGETRQYLYKRLYQHSYSRKCLNSKRSLLCHHAIHVYHQFAIDNCSILFKSRNYFERLLLELVYIHFNENSINNHAEVDNITLSYKHIFFILKLLLFILRDIIVIS